MEVRTYLVEFAAGGGFESANLGVSLFHVTADRRDFRDAIINLGQVFRGRFAHSVCCGRFRCHALSLSSQAKIATRHTGKRSIAVGSASHGKGHNVVPSRLMTEFMRRWRSGEPRAKAWREAQLALLATKGTKENFSNPFLWAASTQPVRGFKGAFVAAQIPAPASMRP